MREKDIRTALLIGEDGLKLLRESHVTVVGLGGVGGYAVESLVRAGVGEITLVDFDTIQESNLNRQIIAEQGNIGAAKTDLFRDRVLRLNSELKVHVHNVFVDSSNYGSILEGTDYLIDAIDSLDAKTGLLEYAYHHGIPTVSVFGAGNRLDPSKVRSGDISESSGCPLGRRVRKALRERNITTGIRVVYSIEEPLPGLFVSESDHTTVTGKRHIGSISYMPGIMGLWAASELIGLILGSASQA